LKGPRLILRQVIAWGLVSLLTSQVKGFAGLVVCRLLLGTTESPFFAGVLFYLSKWYTKKELSLRMAIFYSGSMVSGAFGSLIAAGILNGLAGSRGLSAWQWLYIIEGTITISLGLTICFILPDFPHEWRRLSPDLRRLSIRRMKLDAAADDRDEPGGHSQMRGLRMALLDSKVYMLALAYHCINGASGFQNFFPTLTKTLGFSSTVSLLLVAPPYVFVLVYSYCHATLSDRMQTRFWFYMYTAPVASVGWIIFMTTTAFGPRYFSLFLMSFVFVQRSTIYAWVASSLPRPPAKRAAAYALINALGNSASIWTPYTYRKQDSPRYILALCICIALQSLYSGVGLWLRWKLRKQNAELDRLECLQPLELYTSHKNAGTVKQEEYGGSAAAVPGSEHRGFRYVV
jgi:MFS family permease